jgi:hypothetical protein
MKKVFLPSLCMAFAGISSALAINQSMAFSQQIYSQDLQIMNILDMDQKITEELLNGKLPHLILECSEGTTLPLNILLSGQYLELESTELPPYTLKIVKTCYLKFIEEDVVFSSDLKEWKNFQQFFTGTIGLSLENRTALNLNIELNQR